MVTRPSLAAQTELACAPPRAAMPLPIATIKAGLMRIGSPTNVTSMRHCTVCWYPVATLVGVTERVCTFSPCAMSVLPMLLVISAVSVEASGSASTCEPEK